MKIESIQLKLPEKVINNEAVLDLIRHFSKETYSGNLDRALAKINALFRLSGSEERRVLNDDEKAVPLMREAFEKALAEANWKREDIELLIYVGVGRGFMEPGGSYIIAQAFGIPNAHCFDLVDACMSWTRAMQLVDNFFKLNSYKKAMIINGEFNWQLYGYPQLLSLRQEDQIEYTFPAYTIGEATTVTLLSNEPSNPWEFHFQSRTDLADLCTIPSNKFELFSDFPSERIGKNGPLTFTSYGLDLHTKGGLEVIKVFNELTIPKEEIKIIFPHASSSKAWHKFGEVIGMSHLIYHIYPKTGNLVSASVPAAMALAIENGQLKRGDRVVCWVGSAGMSFASVSFIY